MSKKIMKRSLALGALMAFVITGSAMAANISLKGDTTIINGNDTTFVVDSAVFGGERAQGEQSVKNATVNILNSAITVNDGKFEDIIGGHYAILGHQSDKSKITESARIINGKLNVVINDGEFTRAVVGGSKIARNSINGNFEYTHTNLDENGMFKSGVLTIETESTNTIINGGTFGTGKEVDQYNAPTNLVVGGDYVKDIGWGKVQTKSFIETSNLTINDGTYQSIVVGGSFGVLYCDTHSDIILNVETINTTINGGTFEKPVYAGSGIYVSKEVYSTKNNYPQDPCEKDYEINEQLDIEAENAHLKISNATMKDVYAGGLVAYEDSDYLNDVNVSVDNSIIVIENSKVENVYGSTGYSKINSGEDGWDYSSTVKNGEKTNVDTDLTLTNVEAKTVDVQNGKVELGVANEGKTKIENLMVGDDVAVTVAVDGATNDAINGDASKIKDYISVGNGEAVSEKVSEVILEEGNLVGRSILTKDGEDWNAKEFVNSKSDAVSDAGMALKGHWRAHMNDMNKRMGDLRMANGETGVWTRMVRGESEYQGAKMQYNQYQLGYDEKLSVDKRWTVGAAVTFSEGDSSYGYGSTDDKSTAFAIYGSKLNNDGTFVDLIARYAHLESDLDDRNYGTGDYSTNGMSVSAEFGKRIQQGKGLWIEPQVELTYGTVDSADVAFSKSYKAHYDSMDSFIARAGFALGKDIKQGNVYARASYLYDFDGETETQFEGGKAIKEDFGGGWWEVGVGANINLSKATYIYADVEKTFGGEVDTNWQWNLGVRYSF